MTVWGVFPLASAEFADNVANTIARQGEGFRSVVVLQGGVQYRGPYTTCVVQRERDLPLAFERALADLAFIRAGGGLRGLAPSPRDPLCKFDADDHYGAGYARSVADAFADPRVDWSGMCSAPVRLTDGRMGYTAPARDERGQPCPWGGTVAARTECFAPWPRWTSERSDDEQWARAMHGAGLRYRDRLGRGYTYVRREGSISPIADGALAYFHQLRAPSGSLVFDPRRDLGALAAHVPPPVPV